MSSSILQYKEEKKGTLWGKIIKYRAYYAFVIPAMVLIILFHYVPMFGMVIAFQDFSIFKGFSGSPFVGVENFRVFLKDAEFWRVLMNTLVISLSKLILTHPIPIIFALLLNELWSVKFKRIVQSISYLPHFISWVIAAVLVYNVLDYSTGSLNLLLQSIGLDRVRFMAVPDYFVPIVLISGMWKGMGWAAIVYLSALTSIDTSLYESAEIDGASRFKKVIYITIPSIMPVIVLLYIYATGHVFNDNFQQIYNLQNSLIAKDTDVLETYIFTTGIEGGEYSMATAIGISRAVIAMVLVFISNYFAKKASEISIL